MNTPEKLRDYGTDITGENFSNAHGSSGLVPKDGSSVIAGTKNACQNTSKFRERWMKSKLEMKDAVRKPKQEENDSTRINNATQIVPNFQEFETAALKTYENTMAQLQTNFSVSVRLSSFSRFDQVAKTLATVQFQRDVKQEKDCPQISHYELALQQLSTKLDQTHHRLWLDLMKESAGYRAEHTQELLSDEPINLRRKDEERRADEAQKRREKEERKLLQIERQREEQEIKRQQEEHKAIEAKRSLMEAKKELQQVENKRKEEEEMTENATRLASEAKKNLKMLETQLVEAQRKLEEIRRNQIEAYKTFTMEKTENCGKGAKSNCLERLKPSEVAVHKRAQTPGAASFVEHSVELLHLSKNPDTTGRKQPTIDSNEQTHEKTSNLDSLNSSKKEATAIALESFQRKAVKIVQSSDSHERKISQLKEIRSEIQQDALGQVEGLEDVPAELLRLFKNEIKHKLEELLNKFTKEVEERSAHQNSLAEQAVNDAMNDVKKTLQTLSDKILKPDVCTKVLNSAKKVVTDSVSENLRNIGVTDLAKYLPELSVQIDTVMELASKQNQSSYQAMVGSLRVAMETSFRQFTDAVEGLKREERNGGVTSSALMKEETRALESYDITVEPLKYPEDETARVRQCLRRQLETKRQEYEKYFLKEDMVTEMVKKAEGMIEQKLTNYAKRIQILSEEVFTIYWKKARDAVVIQLELDLMSSKKLPPLAADNVIEKVGKVLTSEKAWQKQSAINQENKAKIRRSMQRFTDDFANSIKDIGGVEPTGKWRIARMKRTTLTEFRLSFTCTKEEDKAKLTNEMEEKLDQVIKKLLEGQPTDDSTPEATPVHRAGKKLSQVESQEIQSRWKGKPQVLEEGRDLGEYLGNSRGKALTNEENAAMAKEANERLRIAELQRKERQKSEESQKRDMERMEAKRKANEEESAKQQEEGKAPINVFNKEIGSGQTKNPEQKLLLRPEFGKNSNEACESASASPTQVPIILETPTSIPSAELALHIGLNRTRVGYVIPTTGTLFIVADVENCLYWKRNGFVVAFTHDDVEKLGKPAVDFKGSILYDSPHKLYTVIIDGERKFYLHLEEVLARFLMCLRYEAEMVLKKYFRQCVIAVPQCLSSMQRCCIEDGAVISGFDGIQFVNDTNAVAVAFVVDSQKKSGNIVVVNGSEETFDIASFNFNSGKLQCHGVTGHYFYPDVDRNVVNAVMTLFQNPVKRYLNPKELGLNPMSTDTTYLMIDGPHEMLANYLNVVSKLTAGRQDGITHMDSHAVVKGAAYLCCLRSRDPTNAILQLWIEKLHAQHQTSIENLLREVEERIISQEHRNKKISKNPPRGGALTTNEVLLKRQSLSSEHRSTVHNAKMDVLNVMAKLEMELPTLRPNFQRRTYDSRLEKVQEQLFLKQDLTLEQLHKMKNELMRMFSNAAVEAECQ